MHFQVNGSADQYARYKKSKSILLGGLQIGIGASLFILNIAQAAVYDNVMWVISSGWWTCPFVSLLPLWVALDPWDRGHGSSHAKS